MNIDLTTLKERWIDEKNLVEKHKKMNLNTLRSIGKNEITFSILDGHMEKQLEDLNKAYEKQDNQES